jgi:hypothetical protein
MNPLTLRKKLLVAESELNRAQLVQDCQAMTDQVHSLTRHAITFSAVAAAVATLVAGLSSLRHKKSAPAAEKPSWLQNILKGVQLVGSLWPAFRPQHREQK